MRLSLFSAALVACVMLRASTVMPGMALRAQSVEERFQLRVDPAQPVIYDNDGVIESGYNDPYIMALASAGRINLVGMVTTSSYGEATRTPPFSPLTDEFLNAERQWLIDVARRSGMRNIPDGTAGPSVSFQSRRPASGNIDDTMPFGTPAAWLIVGHARRATPERPLLVVMGGQPSAVVDAYLLDRSIADKMLLLWQVGHKQTNGDMAPATYNAGVDAWATYIAFERLRLVAFPYTNDSTHRNDAKPATPKARLHELPDTELRRVMMDAYFDRGGGNIDDLSWAYDSDPIVALTRQDYVRLVKRMAFSHWIPDRFKRGAFLPYFRDHPRGQLVVWHSSQAVATEEWWARMKDPSAWRW